MWPTAKFMKINDEPSGSGLATCQPKPKHNAPSTARLCLQSCGEAACSRCQVMGSLRSSKQHGLRCQP